MVLVAREEPRSSRRLEDRDANPGGRWHDRALAALGAWLSRNAHIIRYGQWVVVLFYLVLVAVPAFLPLPGRVDHLWTNLTLFAQFVFWGIWWPFVLLSMIFVGRAWCGILCPEGTLTEVVSARGKAHAIPRWLKWPGWPFLAFACTTVYGQLVSVYQYPKPVLLILGGSTLGAVVIGYLYGRNKRVWCRYLCPVNGVFATLAKLAPVHFKVDEVAWRHPEMPVIPFNCAPLVPVRKMRGASACHMCGRCSGFKGAVTLAARSPNHEIVNVAGDELKPWETALILFGMIGLAAGAFHWTGSDMLVSMKLHAAQWLVAHGWVWPLDYHLPWWMLTNYAEENDQLSILDGVSMLAYFAGSTVLIGGSLALCLAAAARALGGNWHRPFHHLAQSLIPIAGCGLFLGLSAITVTILRSEGLTLSFVGGLRAGLIAAATAWSLWLAFKIARRYATSSFRLALSLAPMTIAAAIAAATSVTVFWRIPL